MTQGVSGESPATPITEVLCGIDPQAVDLLDLACPPSALDELWTAFHDGYGWQEAAEAVVLSPDGSTLFVAGDGRTGPALETKDFLTVAYSADGQELWVARYDGPGGGREGFQALDISPDGERLFVSGRSDGAESGRDYATVAYNTSTGAQLWTAHYDGTGNHDDEVWDLVVSPDGARVFVTGSSRPTPDAGSEDFVTIAYEASTGQQLWLARYDGPASGFDQPSAIAVSPDGSLVFVAGVSEGTDYEVSAQDAAVIAYDANTGATMWTQRYAGSAGGSDKAQDVVASADGSRVYVVGHAAAENNLDFLILSYEASTGALDWDTLHDAGDNDQALFATLSPDGERLAVVGLSRLASASPLDFDFLTVAFDTGGGSELWATRYDQAEGLELPKGIQSHPDGSAVFVTGRSASEANDDYATIAYDSVTGTELSVALFDRGNNDRANALVVSPSGDRVYTTGSAQGTGHPDFGTVAYTWN